ncbi:hypothetical protein BAE44_0023284 [Dichanthelium oligosanthes]|uniref:Gnk2-homologous domain-containing protein n=1 Tax=Dichanthelium oligosanthes TaxID=888268 RepID=A0A1E5US62_9POAL|nr:hypothetical protein BAE44_0023284 [Dichanthelium oligosanthes]
MLPSLVASLIILIIVPPTLLQRCGAADSNTTMDSLEYNRCSTTGNFSSSSPYQLNLGQLLAALPSTAINNSGSFNGTAGSAPDGYVPGRHTVAGPVRKTHAASVSETITFQQTRTDLFAALSGAAAISPLKLASSNRTFNSTHTMYGLAQCSRYLPENECSKCIKALVTVLPATALLSEGVSVTGFSCYIRIDPPSGDYCYPGFHFNNSSACGAHGGKTLYP